VNKAFTCALSLPFAASLYGQVTIKDPIPPTVTRDVDALDVDNELIPRSIFGTFLERIGNSTYNRLWAELLENPSFEVGLWSPEKISEMLHDKPAFRYASNLALPLTGSCLMRVREARSSPSTSTRKSLDRAGAVFHPEFAERACIFSTTHPQPEFVATRAIGRKDERK
jgi:hypothetical protein